MKNISTITPVNQSTPVDQPTSSSDSNKDAADRALQVEREAHTTQSQERMETFENIFCNNSLDYQTWKHVMTGMVGIMGAILSTSIYTLIPLHNVVEKPQYWYEGILLLLFVFCPIYSLNGLYRFSISVNIKFIRTYRHFWALYIMVAFTGSIGYAIIYIIWIYSFKFEHPVPLIGLLIYINSIITFHVTIWYLFPSEWRQKPWFRKRLKFAILTQIYCNLLPVQYGMIQNIFIAFSGDYQWVVAIFLPLVREFHVWAVTKLACKASDGNETCQAIVCTQDVLAVHLVSVSYTVSSVADFTTSALIIGGDFLINVLICLKIIHLNYKEGIGISKQKQVELLQVLVLSEMVEVMVPLCYMICFIMGYYGPNAEVIGNILNSYWEFSAVEDVTHEMTYLCIFLIVDWSSLAICTLLLRDFCGISLYKGFVTLQNEFGWLFSVSLAVYLNGFFIMNLVSSANDGTFRFDWIDGEYNYTEAISSDLKNN